MSAPVDPTSLVLLPLAGAAITAGFGFLGAYIQSRREHDKWVRDRKLEAYVRALTLLQSAASMSREVRAMNVEIALAAQESRVPKVNMDRLEAINAEATEAQATLWAAHAPMRILGPESVNVAMTDQVKAIGAGDFAAAEKAEQVIEAAMRRELKIKY